MEVHLGVQMTMKTGMGILIGEVIAVIEVEIVGEGMRIIIEGVEMTMEEIPQIPQIPQMITIHLVILIMTVKRASEAALEIELGIAAEMAKILPN